MQDNRSPHVLAVLKALLVTFLWSTSWVLIKIGLRDLPPVTFAGLRYTLAFLCLLPFLLRPRHLESYRNLPRRQWLNLALLGILFYAVTQGAQFLGLALLPSVTVSMLLNFTTIVVAATGIIFLSERPTLLHWGGAILNLLGVILYFYPASLPKGQILGLIVVVVGVLANAASSILGRQINRLGTLSPLAVTTASMGIGSTILLASGIWLQGVPRLTWSHWAIIGWLAVVNTALAYTLWNDSLRTLSAMESSIINSTMLIQIAILAWVFLGEALTFQEVVGMVLAGMGTLLVQIRRRPTTIE